VIHGIEQPSGRPFVLRDGKIVYPPSKKEESVAFHDRNSFLPEPTAHCCNNCTAAAEAEDTVWEETPGVLQAREAFDQMTDVIDEVMSERLRQDQKWGVQDHAPLEWLAILYEEVGEVSEEIVETHFGRRLQLDGYRKENVAGGGSRRRRHREPRPAFGTRRVQGEEQGGEVNKEQFAFLVTWTATLALGICFWVGLFWLLFWIAS